jgi:hypothetical protein
MTTAEHDTIVGFDLGDGESAVAVAHASSASAPAVLALPGSTRNQHITAVGDHPTRGILVGERAIQAEDVSPLYLTFKSREFGNPEVRTPVEWFVRRVISDVEDRGYIEPNSAKFVFGAPSSWSRSDRRQYASVLRDAGVPSVDVVAESRAALLYAKQSGELSAAELRRTVLIVDIGSSTTDYTIMRGTEDVPEDLGNPHLGARLIDREILNRSVAAHPRASELRELLETDASLRRRLELHCRKLKEEYFALEEDYRTYPASRAFDLFGPTGKELIPVELDGASMDAVLGTPMAALGELSWKEALERDLQRTKEKLSERVSVVLLTGGPSRMGFVSEICARVFPDAKITPGVEPEFAIAKGLALVGHTSARVEGFRADLRKLMKSGQIQRLVSDRLQSLVAAIGETAAAGIVETLVVPVFLDWRLGKHRTLNDVKSEIQLRARRFVSDKQDAEFKQLVAAWLNELQPEIADLTAPICRRNQLPSDALALPLVEVDGGEVSLPVDTGVATETLETLMQAVTAMIVTATFIVVIALHVAAGPLAPFVLAGTVAFALSKGKEQLLRDLGEKNIPHRARKLLPEATLRTKLLAKADEQEREMATTFRTNFLTDTNGNRARLIETFAGRLNARLEELADEAEFIIKTKGVRRADQLATPVSG